MVKQLSDKNSIILKMQTHFFFPEVGRVTVIFNKTVFVFALKKTKQSHNMENYTERVMSCEKICDMQGTIRG